MKNTTNKKCNVKDDTPIRIIVEAHYNEKGKGLEQIFTDIIYTQLKNKVA